MRTKARLTARDFGQRAGVDYLEGYSTYPSVAIIRSLAAIACELMLDLCHFDADQAFVQSEQSEDVYMRLPNGCRSVSGMVVKLCLSLYGLKQASRQWRHYQVRGMKGLECEQCEADACVMCFVGAGGVSVVAVVHVDDMFAMGLRSRCVKFGEDLNQFVPINHLGGSRRYAGCP